MASSSETGKVALVLCAGIAVIDHVFQLKTFPSTGTKTRADAFVATGGGCAANAAVAIRRLGARARLATPLGGPPGRDTVGDSILARLGAEGVNLAGVVRVEGVDSPVSAILIDAAGERLIVTHRDKKLTHAQHPDPPALVAGVDAVLVDNRFGQFVLPIARAARERNLPVVLDVDQPTDMVDALLTACSHLVFSADGLRMIAGKDDFATALAEIARRTPSFVAVTDGANGMAWLEAGSMHTMPAFKIQAVDTLAAGDIFHGAFALALAQGHGIDAAMRFSAAVAAIKCTRFGGIAGAPTRTEVEEFLSRA